MPVRTVYASSVARLNSNVYTGGGSDDTYAIQSILDIALSEGGVHLVMDGAALVSRLCVYSNTTIECLNKDCGFYQIANTNTAMITNYNKASYERLTRNITLVGGTYNGNCLNQAHDTLDPAPFARFISKSDEPLFNLCIEFFGVEDLCIRDITVREFRTFAVTVGNFSRVRVENVWLDMVHHMGGNQDGLHFWGPGQFLTVKDCGGRTSDDIINIGPDECDKVSSITDVLVDGIFLDGAEQAVRLLSCGEGALDRVVIRNVTGEYCSYGFYICPWFPEGGMGNFGNILIENVCLKERKNTYTYHPPILVSAGGNIENLTLRNFTHTKPYDNRTLFEIGLPFYSTRPESKCIPKQDIKSVIIDGLTVMENENDPRDTDYICIHHDIENLVLNNVLVIKNQDKNGTLIKGRENVKIKRLIKNNVNTCGLNEEFVDIKIGEGEEL